LSHVSKIEIEIKSLEVLKDACNRLGLRFKENQKTYRWFGEYLGDHPLPEGMTPDDLGKCDHAIEAPDCAYDIGVIKKNGYYQLFWDFWSSGGLERKLGHGAGKLKQAYAISRIRREAVNKKYRVSEKQTQTGVRLRLTAAY
jgi:hypothetical protein